MIFHFDGKPRLVRIERRTAGHRPGFEAAIALKPQIVMKSPGGILNDEPVPL
jgi:hypothetical protein